MTSSLRLSLLIAMAAFTAACDKGAPLDNLAPDTRIFLESIQLTGQNRLNSVVQLYWSGEDRDGYVVGYEVSFDGQNWGFTTQSDSLFRFDIPAGSDTVDIDLYVRAVDNDQARDPDPAFLRVPLKNRPPVALFDTLSVVPDTVFSAGSVLFSVNDADGNATIEQVEVKVNGGAWVAIPRNISFLSFLPEQPDQAGSQALRLFLGPDATEAAETLENGLVEGNNRLYLRARDIAGSYSATDSTSLFFLRRQTSDLLVVDDHADTEADQLYRQVLTTVYPGADWIDIRSNRPTTWDPTLGLILGVYDKVFWFSDGSDLPSLGQQLTLEVAASALQGFLNGGGKLFVTTKFPATFNDPDVSLASPLFGFSPMDSLSSSAGQARIPRDSLLRPVGAVAGQLAPLVCGTFITGADPFYPKDPNDALFQGGLVSVGGWQGPNTFVARSRFTNGETNQVFVSVELHKLNGAPTALSAFIDWMLNTAFDW